MALSTFARLMLAGTVTAGLLSLGACATAARGMGGGDMDVGGSERPVLFDWRSSDGGLSGTLSASLPKRTFTGPFAEIMLRTSREALTPFWAGWNEGWGDWPYSANGWDSAAASEQFTRFYSGRVIANLHDAQGQAMRCRFELEDALRGMSGGAHGECQVAGGKILNATIDKR